MKTLNVLTPIVNINLSKIMDKFRRPIQTLFALSVTVYMKRCIPKSDQEKRLFNRIIIYTRTDTFYLRLFECFTREYVDHVRRHLISTWSFAEDFIYAPNLSYVPMKYRTYELCFKAVELDVRNIRFVPVSLIDSNVLLLNGYDNFMKHDDLWRYVGRSVLTEYFDSVRERIGRWSLEFGNKSDRVTEFFYDLDVSSIERGNWKNNWLLFFVGSKANILDETKFLDSLSSCYRRRHIRPLMTGYSYFDAKIEYLLSLCRRLNDPKIDRLVARFDVHELSIYACLTRYLKGRDVSEHCLAFILQHQENYRSIPNEYENYRRTPNEYCP